MAMIEANGYFGLLLTLGAFALGRTIQSRWKSPLCNPLLIASILVLMVILFSGFPLEVYQSGCAPLQYLLTPATICYAVSLYEQVGKLKKHIWAILAGAASGTIVSLASIWLMCMAFSLDSALTLSMLPKSITTAIGMPLSMETGGIVALTTAAIVLTGVLGNILGPWLCRLFRFRSPIAQGVAFGTSSHAIGTTKATELSPLAGAVSSLSLTFAGLMTVVVYAFVIG